MSRRAAAGASALALAQPCRPVLSHVPKQRASSDLRRAARQVAGPWPPRLAPVSPNAASLSTRRSRVAQARHLWSALASLLDWDLSCQGHLAARQCWGAAHPQLPAGQNTPALLPRHLLLRCRAAAHGRAPQERQERQRGPAGGVDWWTVVDCVPVSIGEANPGGAGGRGARTVLAAPAGLHGLPVGGYRSLPLLPLAAGTCSWTPPPPWCAASLAWSVGARCATSTGAPRACASASPTSAAWARSMSSGAGHLATQPEGGARGIDSDRVHTSRTPGLGRLSPPAQAEPARAHNSNGRNSGPIP